MKIFFFIIFLLPYFIFSQYITGKVCSANGEPLPFALIELKSNEFRTRSNINGEFTIKRQNKTAIVDSIIVSYIGFETLTRAVSTGEKPLKIVLNEKSIELNEVVVTALKSFPAEKIVKKSIKSISKNYQNQSTFTKGFYREVIKEEDDWILLNEASIEMNYAEYPQKNRFARNAAQIYRDRDFLPWNHSKGSVFRHLVYFPCYINPKDDEVNIISTRSSVDQSKYGTFSSPVGGPFDLIALDKVKYKSDFLDPKLRKEYTYINEGQEIVNDQLCYVIRFYPKSDQAIKFGQFYNNKPSNPIYTGLLYISGQDFTVMKIEYEFAENIDYSRYYFFNGLIGPPKDVRVRVNYTNFEGKYILDEVETFQSKDYTTDLSKDITAQYECYRYLKFGFYEHTKKDFPEDSLSYLTKSFHINEFLQNYDTVHWGALEQSVLYQSLNEEIKRSLEKTTSLDEQFKRVNITIEEIQAPVANIDSSFVIFHNDTLWDHYRWMQDSTEEHVAEYIEEENSYAVSVLNKVPINFTRGFNTRLSSLYIEVYKDSLLNDNSIENVSRESNGINYRFARDAENGLMLLKENNAFKEDTILNISEFAEGKTNFVLEELRFSDDELLGVSYSEKGGYSKSIAVFDEQGQDILSTIDSADGFRWFSDSSIVYVKQNSRLRSNQVRIHHICSNIDSLLYEEKNISYIIYIDEYQSSNNIIIESSGLSDNKIQILNKENNIPSLTTINETKKGQFIDYLTDVNGQAYTVINSPNGESFIYLNESDTNVTSKERKLIYHTEQIIGGVELTENFVVLSEFWLNKYSITAINKTTNEITRYFSNDSVQYATIFDLEYDEDRIGVVISSPLLPFKEFEIDLNTQSLNLLHHVAFRNLPPELKMLKVPSHDGVKIPLMLLSNQEVHKDSIKGIILKSYGAYGYPEEPKLIDFDQVFVNMGYVVAYAYVRGGGELGYQWHNQGKEYKKINTFLDYLYCANYLKDKYDVQRNQMIGIGASAGALTMGYMANNHPELFGTLIFDRPFLDPLTLMSNSKNVLTEVEYDEWGNPADYKVYKNIKSYSPYQNIQKQSYPNMLFLGGYYDNQAPYWQVVKSAATYRENNLSNSIILMLMNMSSGHKGGTSFDESTKQQNIVKFILYNTNNE